MSTKERETMTTKRKALLGVTGAIFGSIAAALVVATIALGILIGTRDADGIMTGRTTSLSSNGYAITVEDIDLGSIPDQIVPDRLLGTLRFQAQSDVGLPIFIGVGPADEVASYLTNVARSEVTHFGSGRTRYVEHDGASAPASATSQGFWTEVAEGAGTQTLEWKPRSGSWAIVVMNSDTSPGVDLTASTGVETPWALVGLIVTAVGAFLAVVAAVVTLFFTFRPRRSTQVQLDEQPPATPAMR